MNWEHCNFLLQLQLWHSVGRTTEFSAWSDLDVEWLKRKVLWRPFQCTFNVCSSVNIINCVLLLVPMIGWTVNLDNHCYPYIWPSHCKDSHTLHIKNGSKSNTNSQLQSQFSPRIWTIFKKKIMLTMVNTFLSVLNCEFSGISCHSLIPLL